MQILEKHRTFAPGKQCEGDEESAIIPVIGSRYLNKLLDCGINLYIQKEQFNLLGEDGKPSLFAPIMLATLSTCAQLERENITFRLQSGRKQYVAKGGRLGRKPGSVKTVEQKREEYKDVIALLRKGYVIRDVAKLTRKSVSTVQRVKKEFC